MLSCNISYRLKTFWVPFVCVYSCCCYSHCLRDCLLSSYGDNANKNDFCFYDQACPCV